MAQKRGRQPGPDIQLPRTISINDALKRPEPPRALHARKLICWNAIVGAMPAGWLGEQAHDALSCYCFHLTTFALSRRIADIETGDTGATFPGCDALLKDREREGRAALSIARALRTTP